jgi:hypothetical protein
MTHEEAALSPRVPIRRRLLRRLGWSIACVAIAFVALGYLSNGMTADACASDTEQWLSTLFQEKGWTGYRSTGRAKTAWPWVITVHYHYAVGNLGMEQGEWRYLCLFGSLIPLGREVDIQA